MALKVIGQGSEAKSSDLNDNFEYLEGLSTTLSSSKADNNTVVHLTTAETISGNKTFSGTNTFSGTTTFSGTMNFPSGFKYVVSRENVDGVLVTKWSDGYCEQAGQGEATKNATTSVYLKERIDKSKNYNIQVTTVLASNTQPPVIYVRTVGSIDSSDSAHFQVRNTNTSTNINFHWEAKGYLIAGEE